MSKLSVRYLSQEEVVQCGALSMKDAIADLENLYRIQQNEGDYLLPHKIVLKWPGEDSEETRGRINAMPAYLGGDVNMAGIKWIGSGPQNPFKYGLPRASAIIVLNDPVKMTPVAIMDGAVISAMRTGAVTGICAKHLAPRKTEKVALFGAGAQSKTQLMAIAEVARSIRVVCVYDVSYERSAAFAEEMSERLRLDVRPERDGVAALRGADVAVTATTATQPVVHGKDIEKGIYIAHIGGMEVDEAVVRRADKIVVDDWDGVKHRGGDTLSEMYRKGAIGDDAIYAGVQELVCGVKKGRESEDEVLYTCNVGLGTYDIALATRIYRKALQANVGTELTLWESPALI